jgi:Flp pilus assembly pilin Flp
MALIKRLQLNRAASSLEYAALILFLVAALVTMQNYARNALSGRWKQAMDRFGYGRQYEPGFDGATPTEIK